MFRKIVLAGVIAAGCVLVGSPASAASPCSFKEESTGVSMKCSHGKYLVGINCSLQGPLTGPAKSVVSKSRNDGKWTKATCPTGYYFKVGRGDIAAYWDPKGGKPKPIEV